MVCGMSKSQKQDMVIQEYLKNFNASTDFKSYKKFLQITSLSVQRTVFNEKSFEKRILQERVKDFTNEKLKKQFLKDYKAGFEKYGDLNLDEIKIKDKIITGSKWGFEKYEQVPLVSIDGTTTLYKTLYNKKNSRPVMKVYKINWNSFSESKPRFIFVSNQFGIHFRKSETFLKSFVETAALRKQYEVK